MNNFKSDYNKVRSQKDLEDCIKSNLNEVQAIELINAMNMVNETTGLDMRQEYLLIQLNGMIKYSTLK